MLGRRFRFNLVQTILWTLGGGLILFALWGSVLTLQQGRLSAETWQSLIIAGIALGSVYALIALGYTLVYGILFMINFAHGEVFMWGAFSSWFMAAGLNEVGLMSANPWLAFALVLATAMLISMLVAILLERIAYRPLRGAPRLVPLITAIGASLFLQYTARGFFGSGVRAFPNFNLFAGSVTIGPITITVTRLVVISAAIV